MRRSISILLALICFGTPGLAAQVLLSIQPGTQVRVTAPDCGLNKQVGVYERPLGDTLVIGTEYSTTQCRIADVTRLELSRGRRVSTGRAVGFPLAGLLVGGVTGGLIGYSTCAPCNYELEGLAPVFGTALGGTVGFVTGLVVGLWPRDSWQEMPLDRMRLSFTPRRRGFALGVSLTY